MTRLQRLDDMLTRYGMKVDDYDEEVEEDLRPYFRGEKEVGMWCCVTMHDEKPFFLPEFDNIEAAQSRAIEFARDNIFQEVPEAVVNMDTGDVWYPNYDTLGWRRP